MMRRLGYIDGLRAIAVLGVVMHHIAKYDQHLAASPWRHALLEGAHGVDLFFVISGFCLSYPLIVRMHGVGDATLHLAHYLARRLVRIVPPYYAAIAALLILFAVAGRAWQWQAAPGMSDGAQATAAQIVQQMLFLDRHPGFVNGSFWSLAVEFRWYLLFPLLLVLWTRSERAFWLTAVAAFAVGNLTRAAGYDAPLLPAFMLGVAAAHLEARHRSFGRLPLLTAALALAIALAAEPRWSAEFFRQDQLTWQIAAFAFVVAAGSTPALRSLLSTAPFVAVGLASYSIYLVHEPLIGLLAYNTGLAALPVATIAIGCGFAFWVLAERPFVNTRLQAAMVERLERLLARLLRFWGIPEALVLRSAHHPESVVVLETVPAVEAAEALGVR